jgi:EEF1A N-terminal glycine/lysine methyltransferase
MTKASFNLVHSIDRMQWSVPGRCISSDPLINENIDSLCLMEELDIFSSSLETLYDYRPITLASAGSEYKYTFNHQSIGCVNITLLAPNTLPANWSLHASDIWASSIYLADHIDQVDLDTLISLSRGQTREKVHVLELGAGAGLPGILIAKLHGDAVSAIVSDYPDEQLIKTLSDNVARNGVLQSCRAVAYSWGSDPLCLLREQGRFDVIIAADTLWNPDLHGLFIVSLQATLKRSATARVHLVVGLHTGRYTLQSFMGAAQKAGFEVETAIEHEIAGQRQRAWSVEREDGEDERERRRWVLWVILRWNIHDLESN